MSQPKLEVCLSPALLHLYELEGKSVVIIDIFRATTTIVAALYHGAQAVYPVAEIAECIELGQTLPHSITAGERDGYIAPGLQYGNSPSLYKKDFVEGKNLVLTTTNGTRLLHMTQAAEHIIVGAFTNLTQTAEYLQQLDKDVILACASWKDRVNMEDSLYAGALVSILQDRYSIGCDSAHIVHDMYTQADGDVRQYLLRANHYNRLKNRDHQDDLLYSTTIDLNPIVAVYDKQNKNITSPV